MSHEVTTTDTVTTYGKEAWHGLDNALGADDPSRFSVADALQVSKLDYSHSLHPICISGGPLDGTKIPDQYTVVRDDINEPLGVVGSQYELLQHKDMFGWFQPYLDTKEVSFETMGTLKGGRLVWILAQIQRGDATIVDGDAIRKYLLLSSSHDGTQATRVGFTPTRVVCWNTLSMAHNADYKQNSLLRIKHTRSQGSALSMAREMINMADQQFEATAEQMRKLVECAVSEADVREYVKLVFEAGKEVSTKKSNIIDAVMELTTKGIGQDIAPGTAWAAYNGVTEYLTHTRGHNQETRLVSQWYGTSAKTNARALTLAMQLAS